MQRRRGAACRLLARRKTRSWYGGGETLGGVDAVDHFLAKTDLSKSYTSLLAASRKAELRSASGGDHSLSRSGLSKSCTSLFTDSRKADLRATSGCSSTVPRKCQGFVDITWEELPPSKWCFDHWEEKVLFVGLVVSIK